MKLRINPSIAATALVSAGLVAAVILGTMAGPASAPTSAPAAPIAGQGAGRTVPFASVTAPGGEVVRVPVTLPEDCRRAFVRMAPALLASRDALKGILKAEPRGPHRQALEGANVALIGAQDAPAVTAALLDCGSQDIGISGAYREAREAVQGASIAANIIGDGRLNPEALTQLENDLAMIEHALAQI